MIIISRNISIKEVARIAGVSTATVSRVLNNKGNVTEASRQKVLTAVQGLDYHPNMLGQNLRQSSTGIIIVLANTISKPFFIEFFDTLQQAAAANHYHILLGQYGDDEEKFMSYVNMVLCHLADGLLLVNHNRYVPKLERVRRKLPVVQVCERLPESDIPFVSEDWYECSYMAVNHLLSRNYKTIGFINYSHSALFARKYTEGFEDALRNSGILPNPQWVMEVDDFDHVQAYHAAKRILSLSDRPRALFVACDLYAPAAIRAAYELNLRIPEDVAIICGDNSFVLDTTVPATTSIDHNRQLIADAAFQLLLEQINNSSNVHGGITISPKLIVRESTQS